MPISGLIQAHLTQSAYAKSLFAHDPAVLPGGFKGEIDPEHFDALLILELLKQRVFEKEEIISACISARERASRPKLDEDVHRAYWEDTYAHAAKYQSLDRVPLQNVHAMWLRDVLNSSWSSSSGIEPVEVDEKGERSPTWKSGIVEIDISSMLYGITAVSGAEGVGKSRFMNIAAMLAAESRENDSTSGWDVVYFEAENASNITSYRTQRYWKLPWGDIHKKLDRFQRFWVPNHGVTAEDLRDWTAGCIREDTNKLLIVMDSLHTIVDKLDDSSSRGEGYFGLMKQFLMWLQDARVQSGGLISSMIASELNKEGQPKGGKIGYTIDCGVRITEPKGGGVKIQVHKSRETAKPAGYIYTVVDERFVLVEDDAEPDEQSKGPW